jgi:cell division septation protein DedD
MKWLIYLLVLLNVAFFAWQYRQAPPSSPVAAAPISAAGEPERLLLVSEVDPSTLRPQGDTPAGSGALVLKSRRSPEGAPPATAAVSKPAAAPMPTPSTAPLVESASQPGAAAEPAAPVPSTPGSVPVQGQPAGTRAPPAETVSMAARRCYVVGPFERDEPVDNMVNWLRGNGGRVQSRWTEERVPRSYWVYIAPLPNTEEARVMLRRLAADGLQDYVRVMRGPMRNAISLGLFTKRESADRRVALLRSKGYEPLMDTRYEAERVQWLDVSSAKTGELPVDAFRDVFPDAELADSECR